MKNAIRSTVGNLAFWAVIFGAWLLCRDGDLEDEGYWAA